MQLSRKTVISDDIIIELIRKGGVHREQSVKRIIAEYHGYIHKFYIETKVSKSILADLYTDTIIVLIAKIEDGSFKGESKLSTFLYRIFYFKTVDYIRKKMTNKVHYHDNLPDVEDDSKNIEKALELDEETLRIIRALDKMCPPCRQIIMDWAYWGFSLEEIAKRIGEEDHVKLSKIKYGCISKLRKLLGKNLETN
ncbi:RNA polymerase sigma factor [Dyadobacter sp. CY326]|uniref:RNA polymerase sigma factor n=1 Tax=Dyadobacter sp. CY326 TaxID=2907300 RepID=UPI001F26D632|nr:sigma-70 family RNA polymerase sigma factor [Dyadobacter sp. CY326]MCE7065098.1 sigma-70 family RNA polymerase sigma factor [Dyadobacter sp. CY326]